MTPIDANRESLAISRVAQLYAVMPVGIAILALRRARTFRPDRALNPFLSHNLALQLSHRDYREPPLPSALPIAAAAKQKAAKRRMMGSTTRPDCQAK